MITGWVAIGAPFLDGARGGFYMQPNTIDEAFIPYDDTEIVFR
jgi:hypothetical protein